jgi:hypothetical protein
MAAGRRAPDRTGAKRRGRAREVIGGVHHLRDRDGRYRRHLEAASGRITAQSGHPCESKYWHEQDVNWLRANARLIMVYDPARPLCRPAV